MLDYAKVKIKAGDGGRGAVSFRREKYVPKGGPDGGDGGKGGSLYFIASNEVSTLLDFQYLDHFEAENGETGGGSHRKGKDGVDAVIKVPVGSIVKINKVIADIPVQKRRKDQQEEPISYQQKMFNYKKMLKEKLRALGQSLTTQDTKEEPIEDEELVLEQEMIEDEIEESIEDLAITKLDQNDTEDDENSFAEKEQELKAGGALESHKTYRFSDTQRSFDRPFRARNNPYDKYQSEDIPTFDLDHEGEKILLARGGKAGRGNSRFKWSQNQTPKFAEPGQRGEYLEIEIILKMVANIGIIGFPNAGKSTILSKLTAASPKVANYPFTTLEPNLGVTYIDGQSYVLADIPGLIEGASRGKGLGYKFLQHVERTQTLLHAIEIPELTPDSTPAQMAESIVQSYTTIRDELLQYGNNLPDKNEIIVINKIDRIPEDKRKEYILPIEHELQKLGRPYVFISADQEVGLNGLKKIIKDSIDAQAQE